MPAKQEPAADNDPPPHGVSRVDRTWAGLPERVRHGLRTRAWRFRLYGLLAVQAGVAASIAWFVGYQFLDNPAPVLAPTTAVGIVAASMGTRLRRTIELLVGVVLGLAVGDAVMPLFGIGPWQTGLVVVLAIIVAILLKGGGSLLTQAGGTAVLIATLEPPVRDLSVPRFVDAAVGGLVGLAVGLLVVPIHPQRTVQRLAEPVLDPAIAALHSLGGALRRRDLDATEQSLTGLRILGSRMNALDEGLGAARRWCDWRRYGGTNAGSWPATPRPSNISSGASTAVGPLRGDSPRLSGRMSRYRRSSRQPSNCWPPACIR